MPTLPPPTLPAVRATAVLLNPSLEPTASVSSLILEQLRRQRGWESVTITNLLDIPTRNSKELALIATSREPWLAARPALLDSLTDATDLIFGWGVSALSGQARLWQAEQVAWVLDQSRLLGHTDVWMAMGRPRHPSRWRQFVGPQRALVAGESTIDRIDRMLALHPVAEAVAGSQRAVGISSTATAASKPGLPS